MPDLVSVNPVNGETVGIYPEMSSKELSSILYDVSIAFDSWRQFDIEDRCQYFRNIANTLKARRNEYGKLMAIEMGKPINQGIMEIEKSAMVCEYYAEKAPKLLENQYIETDASESYISFQPLGVILGIMPWNFPFWQVFRFVAPTMIAGNSAILKHASNVQGCADAIEGLFLEGGVPQNVFRNLTIGSSKVTEIIENPVVKAVSLTGSSKAGKSVAKTAASVLKKSVLELGGSDPYLILSDADLDISVNACVTGRLINSGQSCIAAKRFIVDKSILSEFENKIVLAMKKEIVGHPFSNSVTVGPLVNPDAKKKLADQVAKSIKAGARLLYESEVPKSNFGTYHPITVLTDVRPGTPAFDEEMFGPIASITVAENESEALALANLSCFGLGSAVFTSDVEKGRSIAESKLEAGAGFVNDFVRSDPRLPFGGVKESGFGNELSPYGILEFLNIKSIYIR